ncbi:unnamed protein product, partial [Mesorhabditis belari]|uniref:GRAM domain-containing protein n=1 Tax=Mesorhabditis belari TaxID=2138241 RepID=A0AAF3F4V5_9BILA
MSLNTANTPDGAGVLIFNGEAILLFVRDVTVQFSKNPNQLVSGKKVGLLYLTSHRIIFMPNDKTDNMKSFEMPFGCMDDVNLEQPIFGANYLRGMVRAIPGSNLAGEIKWSLTFSKGGCIEFGMALLNAVKMAEQRRPENAPPPYAPPSGSFYAAPPDYFEPEGDEATPFLSTRQTHAERPDNVFMQEAPPPYPGMGAERMPVATEELRRAGASITNAPPSYEQSAGELRQRRT